MKKFDSKFSELSPLTQMLIVSALGAAAKSVLAPVGEVLYGYSSKLMDAITPKSVRAVKPSNLNWVPYNYIKPDHVGGFESGMNDWVRFNLMDKTPSQIDELLKSGSIPQNYKVYVQDLVGDFKTHYGMNSKEVNPNELLGSKEPTLSEYLKDIQG